MGRLLDKHSGECCFTETSVSGSANKNQKQKREKQKGGKFELAGLLPWAIVVGWTELNRRSLESHVNSTLKSLHFIDQANSCHYNILAFANKEVAFCGWPASVLSRSFVAQPKRLCLDNQRLSGTCQRDFCFR